MPSGGAFGGGRGGHADAGGGKAGRGAGRRVRGARGRAREGAVRRTGAAYTARVILSAPLLDAGGAPRPGMLLLWTTLMVALAAYLLAVGGGDDRRQGRRLALAWGAHGLALLLQLPGLADGAAAVRFGFAPALSVTAWLVVAVYGIESRFVPLPGVRRGVALAGATMLVLGALLPGELQLRAASPWAPLHWMLGIASYGLFGAAVLHAALLGRSEHALRHAATLGDGAATGMPLLRLERLTFRFVEAGFVVLSLALLLGAWFASPWRWDHKTVFSVLGWGVFASLLGGHRLFGWRGRRATRWLYVGAGLLLLAYVGSRFVLEVLLHRG